MTATINENAALVVAERRSPAELLRYAGVDDERQVARLSKQLIGRLVVLLTERYGLDPALRHLEVIDAHGPQVYVTADGWEYVAARSGRFDGLTYPDVSRGGSGWRATAHAWRKGAEHPFEGRAGCGDVERKDDPEAMAMTRARRRALKLGFADCLRISAEYALVVTDDEVIQVEPAREVVPVDDASGTEPGRPETPQVPRPEGQSAAHAAVGRLAMDDQQTFLADHGITTFGSVWPDQAVADALELPF